jgi:formyltetrahydrofolate deformylase
MSDAAPHRLLATVACPDRRGLVAAIAGFFADQRCNILDSAHFTDPGTGRFFMRVLADIAEAPAREQLEAAFAPVADGFDMKWEFHDPARKPRVSVLASRHVHCLNDLLFRQRHGGLWMEVAAVISNHRDVEALARSYGVPFHYLPVTPDTRASQEAQIETLLGAVDAELMVLARYMQVLSDGLSRRWLGRCINIHHSFLPSFKGARPYHQAYARGVKLIGATAHYVTPDLDEGPIIAQDAVHVDHAMTPDDLIAAGRDVENMVLARAVKAWTERRVFLNGSKTVILR